MVKLRLRLLGHPEDWHYRAVREPWEYLEVLAEGNVAVEPFAGFEYTLSAAKA